MRCVNINHPEFKELLQQSDLDPISLAADVSIWQDKNNTDLFPTLKQLNSQLETLYQKPVDEGIVASEKTIRDLAASMSDRIGIPVRFISDRNQKFKGKLETGVAVVNLAYATLDTPVHEILGHPIIRALKGSPELRVGDRVIYSSGIFGDKTLTIKSIDNRYNTYELSDGSEVFGGELSKVQNPLFNNLLKELESGRGKEVFDRIKRDYNNKGYLPVGNISQYTYNGITINGISGSNFNNLLFKFDGREFYITQNGIFMEVTSEGTVEVENSTTELMQKAQEVFNIAKGLIRDGIPQGKYSLEEQQEEAIVELLGLMTAERLNAVKDGKLISLLKRLLKEIKAFVKNLLHQREVEIDKLPDNMTIGDLADLLAYSNSKLILPGNEVIYTTPDNQTFKTYQEASNHISELAKNVQDVEVNDQFVIDKWNEKILDPTTPNNELKKKFLSTYKGFLNSGVLSDKQKEYYTDLNTNDSEFFGKEDFKINDVLIARSATKYYTLHTEDLEPIEIDQDKFLKLLAASRPSIESFVQKNKEFEQSKEIIEEWIKVNGIRYNPEEIYSRGQEFVSIVGAYSSFDVNLMMQNLLQHIEDNQKAGGEFAVSAITKPVDRKIGHLEGGGGKIRFKIYPQPHDILWAANADVYSGSVWDAGEKINKDKKSELLGVTYSKYPKLSSLSAVKPNLAEIIEDLDHHHNELGIALTGSNFRLEYDEDVPYITKKIINGINKILDQKYGKLRKPVTTGKLDKPVWRVFSEIDRVNFQEFKDEDSAKKWMRSAVAAAKEVGSDIDYIIKRVDYIATQPKITSQNLKVSIQEVKNKLDNSKEYTDQALINLKVDKLKSVAKRYPRALIRSEVKSINPNDYSTSDLFDDEELPFQKVSTKPEPNAVEPLDSTTSKRLRVLQEAKLKSLLERTGFSLVTLQEYEKITGKTYDVNALVDMSARLVAIAEGASVGSALTEELSHIAAYQMEGTTEFNTAMKLIDTYDKYEEYYEEYYPVYEKTLKEQLGRTPTKNEVEVHVKKEILGKAIKEDLEVKLGTSFGMWVRRLWNKFIKLFKNKDLYDYVSHITDQFITNPERDIQGDGIFFQLKEEEKILQGQVNNLKDRLNKLKRRGKLSKETVAQIKALEEELEGNKNGVGIYKFLGLLNNDIQSALDFLKDYFTISQSGKRTYLGIRSDKDTPGSKIILQLSQFIGYYLPFLKELNNILDQEAVIGAGRKQVLDRLIRDQTEKFEVINRAYQQLLSEDALRTVTDAQENIAGEQVIDPNELKHVYQDSNFLETWFAPIRNNTDNILRLVHRLVVDLNTRIKRNVNNWADGLMSQAIDYVGKDISWVAELTTIVDEKTKKPKIVKSGYFLSEVKWAEFNKTREEFHTELHDKYQFSQDVTERYRQKAVIQEYKKKKFKDRSQFEKDEINRLQSYNEEIAKWYARNTVPIKDMDNYIATIKATLSPDQFEFWKNRNMELNEDGSVRYYKRDLVMPSQGKIKTVNTPDGLEDIRTVDWSSPDYFKLSDKDREFLNYLKTQKKELDKSIPFANPDLLPQMYESTLDIMSKMQPDLFKRLKRNIQTSITKNEDDTEFSDTINLGDGSILEDVPIRFTSLLSEPDRVSTDILSSMVAYKQMQENYVQKSSKLPMFENILQAVKRRKVSGKKETIAGEQSWSFTALKNFLQVHIAGKEKEDLNVKVLNTEVNVTKLVEKLSNWVRAKNLGFNFITMTSNLISSKVFATVESLVGNYTTPQSSAFANKELFSNLKGVLTSFNGYKATDRISSLMTYFGLGRDIREQFDDMDKHVLMRGQPDKALMYGYHIGNYFLKSVVMIAVLDNYRVNDNKWYTKKEAEKAGLDFNSMTSAYNMLKTDSDGRVTTMIPESVINNITARINTISNRADGSLSPEDKAAIYQNAVFSMVGLHRGWLFEGLSRRLKSKGYDFTLNQVTEGEYRTVMDLIGRFFMSKQKIQVLKNLLAKYNELEDYQKENLKRVMLELSMIAAFTIIALVLNSGDDDEEDYLRDLLAYQSNRVLLEVSSFYNPNEFVSAIKDPIVPARDLELVTNFTDMFNSEVIEKGKWEGLTKQQKYFLQLVPGVKGYSTLSDPESQNRFLQTKNLKPLYSAYEFFAGEEEK